MYPKPEELTSKDKENLAVMSQQITHLCKQVDDLHVGMYGLPEDPKSGMLFRMQRIEIEKKTKKQIFTSIAAWVALGISTIFGIISTFFPRY